MIDKIIAKKKQEVERLKKELSLNELKRIIKPSKARSFKKSLQKENHLSIIGEIKKASPSKGLLCVDFDPVKIAKTYKKEEIDAVSVLTEKDFFQGDLNYIPLIKRIVDLPILQKDFLIDEYQLYYSAYLKADAILLISSILSQDEISYFTKIARSIGLDVLFEVHNKEDVKKALSCNADIIGINNRDLKTFKIDLNTSKELVSLIPDRNNKVIVSESGIETCRDVEFLESLGVNAVLVGEIFMKSDNLTREIKKLRGTLK